MTTPHVTVLLPVYNASRFLRPAIESILAQTFTDFELVIINDGSTDDTATLLQSYTDPRIRVITHEKNYGLIATLNEGLRQSRGEYIARHDGDDISSPARFAKQVALLETEHTVHCVASGYQFIDEYGNPLRIFSVPTDPITIRKRLLLGNIFCHGSIMFRKQTVIRLNGYRSEALFVEDYDLWLRLADHVSLSAIDEPLYQLRIVTDSVSMKNAFRQAQYAALVRLLARQRQEQGRDELGNLTDGQIASFLNSLLPETPRNRRRVYAQRYYKFADLIYFSGNYASATRWAFNALRYDPLSCASWILLYKVLVCRMIPHRWSAQLRHQSLPPGTDKGPHE